MNKPARLAPFVRRFAAGFAAPFLLALTLAVPGCATRRQVAEIVAQSNAAILGGHIGLPEPRTASGRPAWEEESERIDSFVAAHPDLPAATAPLRIRQAMLLLSHGQFSLAEAAFNSATIGDLHTDRDKALKRSQETLLWWFAHSTNHTWTAVEQTNALIALKQLKEEQDQLAASPEIRDYLAEMRAWIGLSAARQTTSANRARQLLEETLDTYAEIFTPGDLTALATGKERAPDSEAPASDLRRRLRARAVLEFAREINQSGDPLNAHPATPVFDQLINR